MSAGRRSSPDRLKQREAGFDLSFAQARKPEYNPLADRNLRHHFENPRVQQHLFRMGLIDKEGRIIDIDRHKGKISIIEQEFKHAEDAEQRRLREEEELRERIRKKRFAALEEQRRLEVLARIKEDRRIRREMVKATIEARSGGLGSPFSRSGSAQGTHEPDRGTGFPVDAGASADEEDDAGAGADYHRTPPRR